MANVITVKARKKNQIKRGSRGEGVIWINAEATDVLEMLLAKADGILTVKDLASELIKYAANDTIIKVEEETEDDGSDERI